MKSLTLVILFHLVRNSISGQGAFQIQGDMELKHGVSIGIFGDFINNGSLNDNADEFVFLSDGIIGGTAESSFRNFSLQSSGSITLQQSFSVVQSMDLSSGTLDLNSNTLTLEFPSNANLTRTNGFILSKETDNSGKLTWVISNNQGPHVFPFGTAAGNYIPMTVDITSGSFGILTASTYPTNTANQPLPSTPILVTNINDSLGVENSANTVDRFWTLEADGNGTATVTFSASESEIGSLTQLKAIRWDTTSATWSTALPGQTSSGQSVTVPGVNQLGTWALAGTDGSLLVNNLVFDAWKNGSDVNINWETTFEINSDYFTVEKTADLQRYEQIITLEGQGSTLYPTYYSTIDPNPYRGVSYYRLKTNSLDGTETFSNPVRIEFGATPVFRVFPNPVVHQAFTVAIENHEMIPLNIRLQDQFGKKLREFENIVPCCSYYEFFVEDAGNLPAGIYYVSLQSELVSRVEKIIVAHE